MKKLPALLFAAALVLSALIAPCHAIDYDIDLTQDELAFIKDHPVINLGVDPGFVPFEFIDDSREYRGIAADYLSLIGQRTGLKFKVAEGLTWPEAYDKALSGELDALPAVGKTPEREAHFLFSKPYYFLKESSLQVTIIPIYREWTI